MSLRNGSRQAGRVRALELASIEARVTLAEASRIGLFEELFRRTRPWEVEIGFGKGRYLLARAAAEPEVAFLGLEVAREYLNLAHERLRRRGLANVLLIGGEALSSLAAVLPAGFARAVHVYFPDPWPKGRHARRRLVQAGTLDLLLRPLAAGGRLHFATDHLDYGLVARALFESHPSCRVSVLPAWPEGPRTNYEIKYEKEGRPILRLEVQLVGSVRPHPSIGEALACAHAGPLDGILATGTARGAS